MSSANQIHESPYILMSRSITTSSIVVGVSFSSFFFCSVSGSLNSFLCKQYLIYSRVSFAKKKISIISFLLADVDYKPESIFTIRLSM